MAVLLSMAQDVGYTVGGSRALWPLWILIAVAFVVGIAWMVRRLPPGGPWLR